jgi:hypothetical protein
MVAIKNEALGRWTIEGLEPSEVTFTNICSMLQRKHPFKFARYGDGEFNAMFGKKGCNTDGHEYYPDLGRRLNSAILTADYMIGIQPLALTLYPDRIRPLVSDADLYNADTLHNASIDGQLPQFFRSLVGRYVILVGPTHLAQLLECVHIVIPNINCWNEYDKVRSQIEFHIDGVDNAVVILCASMMSEVLIDDFREYHHTFIDAGSVFDPYCGVKSRRYHHKLNL